MRKNRGRYDCWDVWRERLYEHAVDAVVQEAAEAGHAVEGGGRSTVVGDGGKNGHQALVGALKEGGGALIILHWD